jgi:hypothetical protein
VPEDVLERYCDKATITAGKTDDAHPKAFGRAIEKLQELGMVGVWGGGVWIAQ